MMMTTGKSTALAKVLTHYKLLPDAYVLKQKITCPFHPNDVNPSLLINLEDGSWFCFGCQRTGDAQQFSKLMEKKYNEVGDLEALRRYNKILKSDAYSKIKVDPVGIKKRQKPKKQLYIEAFDYYYGLHTTNWCKDDQDEVQVAKHYMAKRGFGPDTLNAVRAKVNYNDSYGLIFPMLDNGKFKGWVCRTMIKEVEAKRKYLYNEGFSRATTLVGDYGKSNYVILVEGYMDRLKFIEYGLGDNVVAILGWKLTKQQEDMLRSKRIKYIISALDNDECGKNGTRYLKTTFGTNNVIGWQYLKGLKDPGDMSKQQCVRMYKKTMQLLDERIRNEKEIRHGRFSKPNKE